MKKIIFLAVILCLIFGKKINLFAEETKIQSRGNIGGKIDFYANDLKYLESEIQKLLNECKENTANE